MKNKKIINIALIFTFFILISLVFVGNYFVNYTLLKNAGASKREVKETVLVDEEVKNEIEKKKLEEEEKAEKWIESIKDYTEAVQIETKDKLKLNGHKYFQKENTNKWLVIVHGYQSNETKGNPLAKKFYEKGYNILTFNLRAHGDSEGKFVGMGILDQYDVKAWIDKLVEDYPESEIVLHGTSMGGFTVLMTGSLDLPSNLKIIIDDCGYTNVWEMFKLELSKRFGLPSFPILNVSNLMAKIRAGYDMKDGYSIDAVKKTDIPTLFIHTEEDDFVPVEMGKELFEAKKGDKKDILIIEKGSHALARYSDEKLYYEKVFEFIDKYFKD